MPEWVNLERYVLNFQDATLWDAFRKRSKRTEIIIKLPKRA